MEGARRSSRVVGVLSATAGLLETGVWAKGRRELGVIAVIFLGLLTSREGASFPVMWARPHISSGSSQWRDLQILINSTDEIMKI
jgi:hypothetical protein